MSTASQHIYIIMNRCRKTNQTPCYSVIPTRNRWMRYVRVLKVFTTSLSKAEVLIYSFNVQPHSWQML